MMCDDAGSADLLIAFAAVVLVSAGFFVAAVRWSKRASSRIAGIAACVLVAALVGFMTVGRDSLIAVLLLPISSVMVATDLTLPLGAALAGVLAATLPAKRRALLPVLLLFISFAYAGRPLVAVPPPLMRTQSPDRGVILQTSDASCGAASATTLLMTKGIPATEAEMARLCRTTKDGTEMLGIYRGLSIKTWETSLRAAVLTGASIDDLIRTARERGPVLIAVGLPRFSLKPIDPRYQSEWHWTPGWHHAVVFFGQLPNGKIDMGDPSEGREKWDRAALDVLWDGQGLYLEKR